MDKRLREISRFFVAPPRVFPLSVCARARESTQIFNQKCLQLSTGLDECPKILLSCFRARNSCFGSSPDGVAAAVSYVNAANAGNIARFGFFLVTLLSHD